MLEQLSPASKISKVCKSHIHGRPCVGGVLTLRSELPAGWTFFFSRIEESHFSFSSAGRCTFSLLSPSTPNSCKCKEVGQYSQPHPNLFFFFRQNFSASSEGKITSFPVQNNLWDSLSILMEKQILTFYKVCYMSIINVYMQLSSSPWPKLMSPDLPILHPQ